MPTSPRSNNRIDSPNLRCGGGLRTALQVVAKGVNSLRSPERAIVLVTHYQRLLDYIVPDHVHVLANGRIIKSGGKELALELELWQR